MTADQAPVLWPLVAAPGLPPRGAQMGIDYFSGASMYADPNGWVLGEPGNGKSALVKCLLWRQAAVYGSGQGARWIAIADPKGEYCVYFGNPKAGRAPEEVVGSDKPSAGPPSAPWVPKFGLVFETRERPHNAPNLKDETNPENLDDLTKLPGIHDPHVDGTRARFDVDTAQLDTALRHLTQFGIRSLTSQPPTLEELFLRHYGDEIAELENPHGMGR